MEVNLFIEDIRLVGVVVKNLLQDWSPKLEGDGVSGAVSCSGDGLCVIGR